MNPPTPPPTTPPPTVITVPVPCPGFTDPVKQEQADLAVQAGTFQTSLLGTAYLLSLTYEAPTPSQVNLGQPKDTGIQPNRVGTATMVARAMEHSLVVTSSSLHDTVTPDTVLRLQLQAPPFADMAATFNSDE